MQGHVPTATNRGGVLGHGDMRNAAYGALAGMDDGHGLTPDPGDVPLGREGLLWPNGSRKPGLRA